MPKRRTHDSFDAEDNPIGLTGAFAPIKGPQSVDYDTNDDPVGLTQAFGAITPEEEDERPWDEETKWKDFDWDAAFGEPVGDYGTADEPSESGDATEPAEAPAEAAPAEEAAAEQAADAASETTAPAATAVAAAPSTSAPTQSGPRHGRHAATAPELSPRMQKSRRVRRVLIVLVILLILVIAAVVFFGYRTFSGSQKEAAQQTQAQTQQADDRHEMQSTAADAAETATKLADVPDLTGLLGKTQDEAIAAIGRGALVTANREVNDDSSAIKTNLNVALTEEAADSKTGTPTVYLGLDKDGKVIQVGYSASASALGFGSLSFADAVNNEHVVEKTLARVGVTVPEGSAKLPENKSEYSSYASDGTTVVRERCSFEGDAEVGGKDCTWSAVLSYDYTTQVVTGNLNDTVRIIYVYITEDVEPESDEASDDATAA